MSKKKHNKVKKLRGENYVSVLERQTEIACNDRAEIRAQIDEEAACYAAHEIFGMGAGRAKAFIDAMHAHQLRLSLMFLDDAKDDEEMAYAKAKNDEDLKKIVGKDNFEAHDIRYGKRIKGV